MAGGEAERLTVRAPATSANLGPGFDVFGLALASPCDVVTLTKLPAGKVEIRVTGVSADKVPSDPERNSGGLAAKVMLKEFGVSEGCAIELRKGIPPGFGLGSSGASAAGVAFGLNQLYMLGLSREELIRWAARGEAAAAGAEHCDNVAAAILGGFVVSRLTPDLYVVKLKPPKSLAVCIATPRVKTPPKKTGVARSVIPKEIPLEKMVHNVAFASSVAAGFALGDVEMIGRSMCDAVVEPARAFLIPGYERVKKRALKAGALGVAISGAGPSMLAIIDSRRVEPKLVAEAMKRGFEDAGVHADAFATRPGGGVSLLKGSPCI